MIVTHFAVVCPPFPSHLHALAALGGALLARGHRVSFVNRPEVAAMLQDAGDPRLGFHAVGDPGGPDDDLRRLLARAAKPGGYLGLRRVIADVAAGTDRLCRGGREVLRDIGAEAVIADQMEPAGGLLAEALGLPFVSVACALPVNREAGLPLAVMPFGPAVDEASRRRNEGSERVYDWMMAPHARVIRRWSQAFGLPPRERLDQCLSPRLQLAQTTPGFDFPRAAWPEGFHAVGPLRPASPQAQPPLALDPPVDADRPFAFASLGTLQGGRFGLWRRIVRAARRAGLQLLVAHCGGLDAAQCRRLLADGARWVVDFAPQQAAIARADVVITHGGLNTVMDALAAGKPMLVLPIAFDQPGVAARVAHAGAGLRLLPALAGAASIERALRRLLGETTFADRAAALGREVPLAGGAPRAAALIEAALAGPLGAVDTVAGHADEEACLA